MKTKILIFLSSLLLVAMSCTKNDPEVKATDLSSNGTANCYIIPQAGYYKFKADVKGNSTESLGGTPVSAEVLWESFGTDEITLPGEIVGKPSLADGYVWFSTPSTLENGNAVIAVKDASGVILWSWHIWICEDFDPKASAHVYNNNAGTVMDRNLGATSNCKGEVQALGLLYQWGRKDPFLNGGSLLSSEVAKSTLAWPSSVSSDATKGTIQYSVANPTTFITCNDKNYDWYYSGGADTDNTRWQTSDKAKGIYDPCPNGWRVPDGGETGLWSKAFGSSSTFYNGPLNGIYSGMDFGSGNGQSSKSQLGTSTNIWYPLAGYRYYTDGSLRQVGEYSRYWSSTTDGNLAFSLYFGCTGTVNPSYSYKRALGRSVRCVLQ